MRKVLYVSGTRADYGLMRSTLRSIRARNDMTLMVAATGMHLMPEFGSTVKTIRNDGMPVTEVPAAISSDTRAGVPRFLGDLIAKLTDLFESEGPDEILLLGDRAEMLAGAIVGTYLGIPTFHVHGGDISSTVDEHARHAITKLAHYHLAATERSAERIRRMGEEEWRIHMVGSPSLDDVLALPPMTNEELAGFGLDPDREFLMVTQHPVSELCTEAADQISGTIDALIEDGRHVVLIYPNADAGGRSMIDVIERRCNVLKFHCFTSVPRDDYLRIMARSSALIGNSSSGLVEAPSLGIPFINIGDRQKGRERGDNVIDVDYGKDEVLRGLRSARDDNFLSLVHKRRNPYGDGCTGHRIADILATAELKDIVQKKLTYTV